MAVKIKLQRVGKIRTPQYRVVVQDARARRGGAVIENLGIYQPANQPSIIDINSERAQYWIGVGAQPTDTALALLKLTGDWQKAKGLEGGENTVKPQPEKEAYVAPNAESVIKEAITQKGGKSAEADEAPAEEAAEAAPEAAEESAEA